VFGVFWAAEGIEDAWPSAAILLGTRAVAMVGSVMACRAGGS
jgi:uncharacterized membrane protein